MSNLPDLDCRFDQAPLMLTLAQITFTQTPEILEKITAVKAGLNKLGMPIAETKQQVNFAIKQGTAAPQISQRSIWWFYSMNRRRAVAVAPNSVLLYEASYTNFKSFSSLMGDVISSVTNAAGDSTFLTSVALRYLSGFPSDGWPSPYVIDRLSGLPVDNLQTSHYHHNYGFWCDTGTDDGGRLVLNAKTVHGNQLIPQDIAQTGVAISEEFSLSKEVDAVQLDIHETVQRKRMEPFSQQEIVDILFAMRKNVKLCFLTATTDIAYKKWKITNS